MSVSAGEIGAHSDEDHGLCDIDAALVVVHEASPSGHPSEGSFHDPAPGENLKAFRSVPTPNHLNDEVQVSSLVHQLEPVIGAVREQVLDPRPSLADRVQDHLRSDAVGDVRWYQVDHQQASVRIHGDMLLAPDNLLSSVVTYCFRVRCLDALAVDHPGRRARFTARSLPVKHQFHVMNGLEQEPPGQFPEPAIDRAPMPEMDRQHPTAAAGSNQIAHRVDHLAEFDLARAPRASRFGHQWRDALPFLVRHVRRITLRLAGNLGHAASMLWRPHPELESHFSGFPNRF